MKFPHRRFDPLRGRWVLVSPTARSVPGKARSAAPTPNLRCITIRTVIFAPATPAPAASKTRPTLGSLPLPTTTPRSCRTRPVVTESGPGLLLAETERGICRVLCFHPDHSLTLAGMELADIVRVVEAWTAEFTELGARPEIRHVQIFENRGAMMGASNPHPHGQIWATEHIPDEPLAEMANQREYSRLHDSCLLCDTLKIELEQRQRIVCENQEFVVLVPFWAVWPFETLVLSRAHLGSMDVQPRPATGLADILKQLTALRPFIRYQLSLHHGLSPASHGWRAASRMAFPRSLLSAFAAFGDRAQIHGGL